MSKYSVIRTDIKNKASLVNATLEYAYNQAKARGVQVGQISKLGVVHLSDQPEAFVRFYNAAVKLHEQPQPLLGYEGRLRNEKAHVVFSKDYIAGAANDVGLLETPQGYQAIISDYDDGHSANVTGIVYKGQDVLAQLKPLYAKFEAVRKARDNGLEVEDVQTVGGRIDIFVKV
jgi:hypothetical protein